jgi:hypothetical protein
MSETGKSGRRKRRQTKDRVLQARIPEHLDEEIRTRAEQLGISVSTVVRNVLFHTFNLVEGVVTDSAQIARVFKERETPPVIGWQEAVLNKNGICETCNAILPIGERAAVGVPVQDRPVMLCLDCLAALASPASDDSQEVQS